MNGGLAGLSGSGAHAAASELDPRLVLEVEAERIAGGVAFAAFQVDVSQVARVAAGTQDDLHPLVVTRPLPDDVQHQAGAEQQVHHHRQGLQVEHVRQPCGHLLLAGPAGPVPHARSRALNRPVAGQQLRRVPAEQVSHGVKHRVAFPADIG